jgi:hypothetical protein
MNLTPHQFQVLTVQEQGRVIDKLGIDLGIEVPEDAAYVERLADDEIEMLAVVMVRLFYLKAGFFVQWRFVSTTHAFLGCVVVSDSRQLDVFLSEVRLTKLGL